MNSESAFWFAVGIIGVAAVISVGSCTEKEGTNKKELVIECIKAGGSPKDCGDIQFPR